MSRNLTPRHVASVAWLGDFKRVFFYFRGCAGAGFWMSRGPLGSQAYNSVSRDVLPPPRYTTKNWSEQRERVQLSKFNDDGDALSPPQSTYPPPKNCPVSAQEIVRGDRYCPTLSGILVPTHLPFLKAPFGEIVTVCLRINLLLADLESDSLLKGGGQRCPPCPAMRCVLAATAGGQPLPIALPPRCASSILSVIAGRPPHHTDGRTHNPAHMRTAPQPKLYTAHHHIHICD